jgi:hypothetical protein
MHFKVSCGSSARIFQQFEFGRKTGVFTALQPDLQKPVLTRHVPPFPQKKTLQIKILELPTNLRKVLHHPATLEYIAIRNREAPGSPPPSLNKLKTLHQSLHPITEGDSPCS